MHLRDVGFMVVPTHKVVSVCIAAQRKDIHKIICATGTHAHNTHLVTTRTQHTAHGTHTLAKSC